MNTEFSTMHFDRKYLVIKTEPNRNPLVIAECYLPETAETICELLTADAAQKANDKPNDAARLDR